MAQTFILSLLEDFESTSLLQSGVIVWWVFLLASFCLGFLVGGWVVDLVLGDDVCLFVFSNKGKK